MISSLRIITFLSALLFNLTTVYGQEKKGGDKPAFSKGSKTLGVALGLGSGYDVYGYGYGSGYYGIGSSSISRMPSFIIFYDQGIINNAGPGTVGIGGIFSINSSAYKYSNGDRDRYTNITVGLRGTYHLTILKDKNNKFDPYGGVTGGLRIFRYTENYGGNYTDGDVYPMIGVFVGAKYNFKPNFGVFTELGYDVSIFKIGFNFNF